MIIIYIIKQIYKDIVSFINRNSFAIIMSLCAALWVTLYLIVLPYISDILIDYKINSSIAAFILVFILPSPIFIYYIYDYVFQTYKTCKEKQNG